MEGLFWVWVDVYVVYGCDLCGGMVWVGVWRWGLLMLCLWGVMGEGGFGLDVVGVVGGGEEGVGNVVVFGGVVGGV